jgi:uncharacterized protein (TIGR00730 family)
MKKAVSKIPLCRFPHSSADKEVETRHTDSNNLHEITWRIFRIMAEFVDGFQFLSTSRNEITVFGSARLSPNTHWYNEAVKFGEMVGKCGFTMITGGGPGIMEAANKGTFETGGESLGLNIQLPMEQRANKYITRGKGFHYFFTRKVMLSASAQAYVFFPGGFGTLNELTEMVMLIQTGKMQKIPIVLVGKEFWTPYIEWIKKDFVERYKTIDAKDLKIMQLVDSAEEAWNIVKKSKERHIF